MASRSPQRDPWSPQHDRRRAQRDRRRAQRRVFLAIAGVLSVGLALAVLAGTGTLGGDSGKAGSGGDSASTNPATPVQLTIAASGDLLIHSPVWERARTGPGQEYDFRPMFRYVKPIIQGADLGICHMETPLTTGQPAGYPVFAVPADLAPAIKSTGWDACTTASNHTLDRGQPGINATLHQLDRSGVKHTGSFRSRRDQTKTLILRSKGVKVALLAYTAVSNGQLVPHPYSVNRARRDKILAAAARARRRGAQAVIVSVHWGTENVAAPNREQRTLASALTRSPDVTAVIGQHVHVIQPIRWMHGKPVVFGEGNFISNQTAACCPPASQDGLIALLHMTVDSHGARVTSVDHVSTYVRHPDFAVLPVRKALKHVWGPAGELRASQHRTRSVVGRKGEVDSD